MVSLLAFVLTANGLAPYFVASFSSGLACENAKVAIIEAAANQSRGGSSTYSLTPKSLQCIATPGLVSAGARPPEPAPRTAAKPRTPPRQNAR